MQTRIQKLQNIDWMKTRKKQVKNCLLNSIFGPKTLKINIVNFSCGRHRIIIIFFHTEISKLHRQHSTSKSTNPICQLYLCIWSLSLCLCLNKLEKGKQRKGKFCQNLTKPISQLHPSPFNIVSEAPIIMCYFQCPCNLTTIFTGNYVFILLRAFPRRTPHNQASKHASWTHSYFPTYYMLPALSDLIGVHNTHTKHQFLWNEIFPLLAVCVAFLRRMFIVDVK